MGAKIERTRAGCSCCVYMDGINFWLVLIILFLLTYVCYNAVGDGRLDTERKKHRGQKDET